MQFKGGLINGVITTVYGSAAFLCLFYGMTPDAHMTMQRICWVLAALGVIIAIYLLATKEVLGIPIFLIGLIHGGLAQWSEHSAMEIGCAALGVITVLLGAQMLEQAKPMGSST